MAYQTLLGYCLGRWFHRAHRWANVGYEWLTNASRLFVLLEGTVWTYLYSGKPIYTCPCRNNSPMATPISNLSMGDEVIYLKTSTGPSTIIGKAPHLMSPKADFMATTV
jgi:hypothetical protein